MALCFLPMPKAAKFKAKYDRRRGRWYYSIPAEFSNTRKRKRVSFRGENAEEDCKKAAAKEKERADTFGQSLTFMTPPLIAICGEAMTKLFAYRDRRGTLLDIRDSVDRHIAWDEEQNRSKAFLEVWDEFIDSKRDKKRGYSRISKLETHRAAFKDLRKLLISNVTQDHLEPIVEGYKIGYSRNGVIAALWGVFEFAAHPKRRYIKENPIGIWFEKQEISKGKITVFSNDRVRRLLNKALEKDLELVPYIALGAFAGLRIEGKQILHLQWPDVHFDETFTIKGLKPAPFLVARKEYAKTDQRKSGEDYTVLLSDNLIAWLQTYRRLKQEKHLPKSKYVICFNLTKLRRAKRYLLHEVAGKGTKWPQFVLRHTFCSNHLAYHRNADALAPQMEHGESPQLLNNRYANKRISYEDSAEFWNIYPPGHTPH